MNYIDGIQHMQELVRRNQQGYFTPKPDYPALVIHYPGYKATGDYRMEVNGCAITHSEICEYLYDNSNKKYQTYVRFLEDIYTNGTDVNFTQYTSIENADKLSHLIYWATLQEEINYPQSRGANGRRLPFCRYFEAIYAANFNIITINQVKERCQNHGSSVPQLLSTEFNLRPSFYHL